MALMVVAAIFSQVGVWARRRAGYLEDAAAHARRQESACQRIVGHRLLASGSLDAAYSDRLAREDASAFARLARHRRLKEEYERLARAPWSSSRIEGAAPRP